MCIRDRALLKDIKQLHQDKEEVKLPAYQQIVDLLNGWESKSDEMCIRDRDMTRTYFCKEASDEYKKIHDIVRVAYEKAEEIIRPGVRLCDIDLTARNYISSFGYGEYLSLIHI